jgi:hypothetical protein
LNNIRNTIDKLLLMINQIGDLEPNPWQKNAAALFCVQFYNGIENIFKRIIRSYSIQMPKSERSHSEIFEWFSTDKENNLPILITNDIRDYILAFMRIRHLVIHNYSTQYEWKRLKIAIIAMPDIFSRFSSNVNDFLDTV